MGYAPTTTAGQLQLVARFSRSLQARGLAADELSAEAVEEFFADLHAHHGSSWPTSKSFVWLVEYLNDVGIAMAALPGMQSAEEEEVVGRFRCYLLEERGLARKTVIGQERTVRLFLAEHSAGALHDLAASDISRFVTRQCRDLSTRSAERLVNGLRSFLRFALVEGLVTAPLANAVPSVGEGASPPCHGASLTAR